MATTVTITRAVQGARHEPITVRWGIDLTGVVAITGTKQEVDVNPVVVTELDGTFDITDAANGVFEWSLGEGDVGTNGHFDVQFKAQFADEYDMTFESRWVVGDNQGAGVVPAGALIGVTGAIAAALNAANDPSAANPFATMDDLDDLPMSFTGLDDTPNSYAGQGSNPLRVNAAATAVEFATGVDFVTDDQRAGLDAAVDGLDADNYAVSKSHLAEHEVRPADEFIFGHVKVGGGGLEIDGDGLLSLAFDVSAFIETLLDDANAGAARTTLGAAATADLTTHTSNTSNPHSVTAAQADALPENAAILSKSGAYQLAAGDEGKIIECTGSFTLTCPNGLATGFQVMIANVGSGTITLAATTTLQSDGTLLETQYTGATVYHRGSNVWLAMGRLT